MGSNKVAGRPKSQYDKKTGAMVEKLASRCVTTKEISIICEFSEQFVRPGGLYREDWERGKAKGRVNVKSAYYNMATSEKDWGATKHFLATQCNIIEPKETEIMNIIGNLTDEQLQMLKDGTIFNNAAKIVAYIPDNGRLKEDGNEEDN